MMNRDVKLYSNDGKTLVAVGEMPYSIVESKVPIRFRNKSYYYLRHGFDSSVHYHEMPEPVNVDDMLEETQ